MSTRLATTLTTLLAVAASLGACSVRDGARDDDGPGIAATGSGGERHYAVGDFTAVALAASGDVTVRTGQAFGVTVTGDPSALDTLKVRKEGTTLQLGRRNGISLTRGAIHWVVTMPRIEEASIGGSGTIAIDRVEGKRFAGNIGGSGDLDIGRIAVEKATFSIGGSGSIVATGSAEVLDLSVGGSGKLRAPSLVARTATISIAGAGDVAAAVQGHADVNIVGSGDVTLTGGAQCKVTKIGGGTVRCS